MRPGIIVTFARTIDAFAFEDAAHAAALPGRLIPLPTQVSASCGLAWLAPLDADLTSLDGLAREGVYRRDEHGTRAVDA